MNNEFEYQYNDFDELYEAMMETGPEGGKNGGTLVGQGTPEAIIKIKKKPHW